MRYESLRTWKGIVHGSILLVDETGISQFSRSEKLMNPGDPITSITEDLVYSLYGPATVSACCACGSNSKNSAVCRYRA